jgi:hypothetical protein
VRARAGPGRPAENSVDLLDLARTISFLLMIFSLLTLLHTALFVIGTTWEQRLVASMTRVALAACILLAGGLLFRRSTHPAVPISKTLSLFAVAWYLDIYYMPQRSLY